MLSPPQSASRPASQPTSQRDVLRGGGPGRAARLVAVLGALTALAAVAFVFAPVRQTEVTYTWTPADGAAVALPLMPYQPTQLSATTSCAAARRGVQLATVPPRPDPAAAPLAGLTVVGTSAGVTVTSAGVGLGTVALPPGDCTLTLFSDTTATTLAVDGAVALSHAGDVRPDVAGIFSDAAPGTALGLTLTADTRFATTPTPLKLALAAACLLGAAALVVVLAGADRAAATRRLRLLPPRWWRPRPVDGVVTTLLAVWWVVGAGTVDDGYVAGIVRSRADNGFVGNVYRWLNAPEAPFSWYDEPYRWWSALSVSTPWMRLPSTLLGLLCWALVSRLLLPRLGAAARRPATAWVAALAFTTWWLPFNLGLRPEPWVAVGVVLVVLAVERTVATRRLVPLALALAVAGATAALTPGGLMAFAPVLAAAVPLLRLLRARTDLHLARPGPVRALPLLVVLVAAPATALLLMAADQGAAALVEAVRARGAIGGGRPWHEESARYALLVTPGDIRGSIGRRAAVLPTILAAVGIAWTGAARVGIVAGPARRLLVTLALSAVAMMFTPTKWTQHFGGLAGLGAAVLTLGLVAFGRDARRRLARDPAMARRWWVAGLAGATVVAGQVLGGQNMWPFVSSWYRPTFSTLPPQVGDVALATIVVAAGGAVVVLALARSGWRRSAPTPDPPPTAPRRPAPATLLSATLVAVLALQVLSLVRVAAAHPGGYTPTADAIATATGDPCGLQSALLVETDPSAGILPPQTAEPPGPGLPAAPVDVGGTTVPGVAVTAPGETPWYTLDARQRSGALPVVVTVAGSTRPVGELAAEFARGPQVLAHVPLAASARPADRRLLAPPDADAVRLTVTPGPAVDPNPPATTADEGGVAVASLPRAPVLTPMTRVLPRGTRAILDWPVAFVFPCLDPEPLPPGTAGLARWRVGPPSDDPSADITYTPGLGGPFAAPRLLVTEHRMPTYLRDDPTVDPPQLYRWDPVVPLRTLTPTTRSVTAVSLFPVKHLRVPRLPEQE